MGVNLNVPRAISTRFLNSGRTPAFDFEAEQWVVAREEFPEQLDRASSLDGLQPIHTIAAKEEKTITSRSEPFQAAEVLSGAMKLCVYGHASYSDIWGVQHELEWCHGFDRQTGKFIMFDLPNERFNRFA